MTPQLVKVTERVSFASPGEGEAEEGWISRSLLYVLLVFKVFKRKVSDVKMRVISLIEQC